MFDATNTIISNVSIHHTGNKNNEEDLIISKNTIDLSDVRLQELLLKFFLPPFTSGEFYGFTFSNEDFRLNPLYNFSKAIFEHTGSFHINSVHIAKHLYEVSVHPQIKAGDLFVVSFSGITLGHQVLKAIGIFKSENRHAFLKLDHSKSEFSLEYDDEGINIEKLDKGCLIFDTEEDKGFKVCIVDRSNRSGEAQFWKDNFLMLKPYVDEYHQTKEFLNITRNYVTRQLAEEFEVSRTDQIDLLNRSMDYFKSHDSFEKKEFEKEVLQDPGLINSFRKYDEAYRNDNSLELNDSFEISSPAVKKQNRVFKSVLKLDKNFHIYIHGNKEMIEHGIEKDGRKFYKIYYDKEG